jgi:hypothetical protein
MNTNIVTKNIFSVSASPSKKGNLLEVACLDGARSTSEPMRLVLDKVERFITSKKKSRFDEALAVQEALADLAAAAISASAEVAAILRGEL